MIPHGGDVWRAADQCGIAPADLLDFSANINPRGLPPRARERLVRDASDSRLLSFYPDPSARRLRNALSLQLDIPMESIVVGPGAEALLAPVLRSLDAKQALVPVPAFSEYRRVCEQQRMQFTPFPLDRSEMFRVPVDRFCRHIEAERDGLVFLNNPHNPSGAMLHRDEILRVLETGATLLLDEAFIDYIPGASMVSQAAAVSQLIVLRSLTKFYGCPALRVGYAVAHPDTVRRIASTLPTWPITQLAIDALAEAVADREYQQASLRDNLFERERLAGSLQDLGFTVFPSAANFLLLETRPNMPPASELQARLLGNHRILIRNCDSYEGLEPGRYIRVAVRSGEENFRLLEALAQEFARN